VVTSPLCHGPAKKTVADFGEPAPSVELSDKMTMMFSSPGLESTARDSYNTSRLTEAARGFGMGKQLATLAINDSPRRPLCLKASTSSGVAHVIRFKVFNEERLDVLT
jgi:hypothetical protein